jgi:hypothetical protein
MSGQNGQQMGLPCRGTQITTAQTRMQLHSVYQTVIFVLESVVFSLIFGLELPTLVRELSHTTEEWLVAALAVSGTLIATRAAWVFSLSALSHRRGGARPAWPAAVVVSLLLTSVMAEWACGQGAWTYACCTCPSPCRRHRRSNRLGLMAARGYSESDKGCWRWRIAAPTVAVVPTVATAARNA